jgi:hypothetical protein
MPRWRYRDNDVAVISATEIASKIPMLSMMGRRGQTGHEVEISGKFVGGVEWRRSDAL